jgi:hypothetical protein
MFGFLDFRLIFLVFLTQDFCNFKIDLLISFLLKRFFPTN